MKKIILSIIGIMIISNATVFFVNEMSHNHEIDVNIEVYEQQLVAFSNNCEPLECTIIANFNRINKQEYTENIKQIAESIRPILGYKNGPKIGIAILNIVFKYGDFDCDEKLYFLDKIATLKYKDNDLFGMIDPILSYIQIANDSGDKFKIATGELSLALAISYFKGYEFSNEIIESIIDNDESNEWYKLKSQAMLSLAENNLAMGHPKEALESLDMVEQNKVAYNEEDWRDYDIYTLSLKSEAYIALGQLNLAKSSLAIAKIELEKDKSRLLLGKKVLISVVEFQLAFKQDDFSYIEEKKEELLSIVDGNNQRRYAKIIYTTLFEYYRKLNNIDDLYNINARYYKLMDKRQSDNYRLLISNKLKQNENNHLNEENKKSIFFIKIAFIILVTISVLLLFTIVKIKYLNVENFTDPLTRCPNRRKFMIDYDKAMKIDHGFLILDIDNFKSINDNYGHDVGDYVLVKVANVLKIALGNDQQCYRIGGEEFVVIFDGSNKKRAIKLAEDIRYSIENIIWNDEIIVTISGGLSFSDVNKNTYKAADELLYKAKRGTKNIIINDIE
ncbi:GGDEF domain-containing protein [Aliivibrio salmonicida]|uniref:GGDEF domain-containing protein n=1 Tax=Aliivibrio salmonicida TaxID=40269 RepID=UPI00406CC6A8